MAKSRFGEFLFHLRWGTARTAGAPMADGALLRRFAESRDEAAFALLVQRHGPMVLGVCCRVLGPGPDAEDAFQATFVVLARRAAVLADREVVGNWLFGVARRTALKARALAARRRTKEREMARPEESRTSSDSKELREVIDVAIARLPAKYRIPVVLCELEGRSLREAASELGWPEGTVAGRLSRGRAMLRTRLLRTWVPAGLALTVPTELAMAAVRAASSAHGEAGLVSSTVATLASQVQRQMSLARAWPIAVGLGFAFAIAGAIAVSRGHPDAPPGDTKPLARANAVDDPLPPGAIARLGTSRLRHGGQLQSLAFTADGTGIVASGRQWANQVWDVRSGRHRLTVTADRLTTTAVAVSRDGSRLAACPNDKACVVWDTATGRELRRVALNGSHPRVLAISPDGRLAVGVEGKIEMYSPNGARERELAATGGTVALTFTNDGGRLAAAQLDGSALVFNVATGELTNHLRAEPNALAVAFAPAGDVLALGTQRGIHLFDLATSGRIGRLNPGIMSPALAISSNGNVLVSAAFDGRVQLWDWRAGTLVRDVVVASGTAALAFSLDDANLAVGGSWQTVRLFDTATGRERHPGSASAASVYNMGLTTDGERLVTFAGDGFQVWDTATGQRGERIEPKNPNPIATAVSPDGRHIAGSADNRVRVWELNTGREVCVCDGPPELMYAVAYSPDEATLVGLGTSGLRVWDPATGRSRGLLIRPKAEPRCLAFAADGPELAVGYHDGSLAVWNVVKACILRENAGERPNASAIAFGPKSIATVSPTRICVRDSATMAELWGLDRPRMTGHSPVALSPDGHWLAWTIGTTVRLVEAKTGRLAREFRGHVAEVSSLKFAPDSARLYSASLDTTVLIWDVRKTAP